MDTTFGCTTGYIRTKSPGVVLVDAAHEEEGERVGPWGRGRRIPRWLWYPNYLIARMLAETGVLRLMHSKDEVTSPGPGWSHEQSDILSHLQRRPEAVAAGVSSGGSVVNDRLAHESGGLGNKPLIVLTAGKAHPAPLQFAKEVAACQDVWKYELQPKLARLSTRGRQVIVENASHAMPFEVPEVVVGAVKQVVEEVRGRQD